MVLTGLLAAALGLAGCGSSSSEEGPSRAALRIETALAPTGEGTELIVSIDEPEANRPKTAGNRKAVALECLDQAGAVLVRARHPWPFTDTDDGLVDPHVHQPVPSRRLTTLKRCRLDGTDGPLSGRVTGPAAR